MAVGERWKQAEKVRCVSTKLTEWLGQVIAGIKRDPRAVKWGTVAEIVLTWIVTLPAAALIAGGAALVLQRHWMR
jgi:phosphate/sulfate permease